MDETQTQESPNYIWFQYKPALGAFGPACDGLNGRTGVPICATTFRAGERPDLQQEFELLLSKLDSNYIVKHLAMEEVEGLQGYRVLISERAKTTLASLLKKRRFCLGLPLRILFPLILHLAEGLHYLDVEMIAHGGIKPENILICEMPGLVFKISGFDCARRLQYQDELVDHVLGIKAFTHPSLLKNFDLEVGRRCRCTKDQLDLWPSACCILLAATGCLPKVDNDGRIYVYANDDSDFETLQPLAEMLLQRFSYYRQFTNILREFFEQIFSQNLNSSSFYELCREMTSLQRYKYYDLNALRKDRYFDTTTSNFFRRTSFYEHMENGLRTSPGMLGWVEWFSRMLYFDQPNGRRKILKGFECVSAAQFQPSVRDGHQRLLTWEWDSGDPSAIEISRPTRDSLPHSDVNITDIRPTDKARRALRELIARTLQTRKEEKRLRIFFSIIVSYCRDALQALGYRFGDDRDAFNIFRSRAERISTLTQNIDQRLPRAESFSSLKDEERKSRRHEAGTAMFSSICLTVETEYRKSEKSLANTRSQVSLIFRSSLDPLLLEFHDLFEKLDERALYRRIVFGPTH